MTRITTIFLIAIFPLMTWSQEATLEAPVTEATAVEAALAEAVEAPTSPAMPRALTEEEKQEALDQYQQRFMQTQTEQELHQRQQELEKQLEDLQARHMELHQTRKEAEERLREFEPHSQEIRRLYEAGQMNQAEQEAFAQAQYQAQLHAEIQRLHTQLQELHKRYEQLREQQQILQLSPQDRFPRAQPQQAPQPGGFDPQPSRSQMAQNLFTSPDQTVRIFSLQYASPQDVSGILEQLLGGQGRVIADARTNNLIISAPERRFEMVEQIIQSIDRPAPSATAEMQDIALRVYAIEEGQAPVRPTAVRTETPTAAPTTGRAPIHTPPGGPSLGYSPRTYAPTGRLASPERAFQLNITFLNEPQSGFVDRIKALFDKDGVEISDIQQVDIPLVPTQRMDIPVWVVAPLMDGQPGDRLYVVSFNGHTKDGHAIFAAQRDLISQLNIPSQNIRLNFHADQESMPRIDELIEVPLLRVIGNDGREIDTRFVLYILINNLRPEENQSQILGVLRDNNIYRNRVDMNTAPVENRERISVQLAELRNRHPSRNEEGFNPAMITIPGRANAENLERAKRELTRQLGIPGEAMIVETYPYGSGGEISENTPIVDDYTWKYDQDMVVDISPFLIKTAPDDRIPESLKPTLERLIGPRYHLAGYWFGNAGLPGAAMAPIGDWNLSLELDEPQDEEFTLRVALLKKPEDRESGGFFESDGQGGYGLFYSPPSSMGMMGGMGGYSMDPGSFGGGFSGMGGGFGSGMALRTPRAPQGEAILRNVVRAKMGRPIIVGYTRQSEHGPRLGALVIVPTRDFLDEITVGAASARPAESRAPVAVPRVWRPPVPYIPERNR